MGRPLKRDFPKQLSPIGTRVTSELRGMLLEACDESGKSMSQEIEERLRDSFRRERRVWEIITSYNIGRGDGHD